MRKAFVLLVCIRMYPYVSRMYPYVTRMLVVCQSYVFVCIRMFRMSLVCYPYVLVWCFSHDRRGFRRGNFNEHKTKLGAGCT